jgi:hypothetical protein
VVITDLKNMADCLWEWDKQDFNFKRHIFEKSFHIQYNKLEAILFEEMRRIDLQWEIVKYTASLL